MSAGSFILLLHGHLPYCKKAGVWPFGEEWVFEALAETYIPVLNIFYGLRDRRDRAKIAMSFTPILIEQLADPYMIRRFEEYLEMKMQLARDDVERFANSNEEMMADLARAHRDCYEGIRKDFVERYSKDVVGAFRGLMDEGMIEVVAGAATHAYLPLLTRDSVASQVEVGLRSAREYFGRVPVGLYLSQYEPPSCLDMLAECGIHYIFLDSPAIESGQSHNLQSTYLPYYIEGTDLVAFGRNRRTGLAVWSPEWGYPGDGAYREFHKRDSHSGLRYWRVTNKLIDLDAKELYDPQEARRRADDHAGHFTSLVLRLLEEFKESSGTPGVIVAPYDVELFGHWWFEGIDWLRRVLERFSMLQEIELDTPSSYLARHAPTGRISLPEAPGALGVEHEFIWEALRRDEARMTGLTSRLGDGAADGLKRRLFNQAARELLLMESSDWPLLVAGGQAGEYALERFSSHKERFERMAGAIEGKPDAGVLPYLEELEELDGVFRYIDFADIYRVDGPR